MNFSKEEGQKGLKSKGLNAVKNLKRGGNSRKGANKNIENRWSEVVLLGEKRPMPWMLLAGGWGWGVIGGDFFGGRHSPCWGDAKWGKEKKPKTVWGVFVFCALWSASLGEGAVFRGGGLEGGLGLSHLTGVGAWGERCLLGVFLAHGSEGGFRHIVGEKTKKQTIRRPKRYRDFHHSKETARAKKVQQQLTINSPRNDQKNDTNNIKPFQPSS